MVFCPTNQSNNDYTGYGGTHHYSLTTTDTILREGEFMQISFPFKILPSQFWIDSGNYGARGIDIVGSNDDGVTWDYLGGFIDTTSLTIRTINMSGTAKFNTFRFIFTRAKTIYSNIYVKQIKFYGDIYAL